MRDPSSGAGALGRACRDKPAMPESAMPDGRMPDGRPKPASATDRAEMAAMASTTMPGNVSAQRGVLQGETPAQQGPADCFTLRAPWTGMRGSARAGGC
jgi:hypothetical protein